MRSIFIAISAAFVWSTVPDPASAANCHLDPYSFHFGVDTSTRMTVKSGTACGSTIRFGNGGGPSNLAIVQQAANGTASAPNMSRWEYVSRRGFTGQDRFVVGVTGESMGRYVHTGTTQIAVDVDVTP